MDFKDPMADRKYSDAISELNNHGIEDIVNIYSLPEELLTHFGSLGQEGACHVHRYVRDRVLNPLGLLQTRDEAHEVITVEDDSTADNSVNEGVAISSIVQTIDSTATLINNAGGSVPMSQERIREVLRWVAEI